jgi:hypothetical protein
LAAAIDPGFTSLETQADVLNPHGTAYRYLHSPGMLFPSIAEVNIAIEHTQTIYDLCSGACPVKCVPFEAVCPTFPAPHRQPIATALRRSSRQRAAPALRFHRF